MGASHMLGGLLRGFAGRRREVEEQERVEEQKRQETLLDIFPNIIARLPQERQGEPTQALIALASGKLPSAKAGQVFIQALSDITEQQTQQQPALQMPPITLPKLPPTQVGGPQSQASPQVPSPAPLNMQRIGGRTISMPPPPVDAGPPPDINLPTPSLPGVSEQVSVETPVFEYAQRQAEAARLRALQEQYMAQYGAQAMFRPEGPTPPAGIVQVDVEDAKSPTGWAKVSIVESTGEEVGRVLGTAPPSTAVGREPNLTFQEQSYADWEKMVRDGVITGYAPNREGYRRYLKDEAKTEPKGMTEYQEALLEERAARREEAQQAEEVAAAQRVSSLEGDMDRLAAAANDLKNHPGMRGAVGFRIGTQILPGTNAANFAARLETLKSQIAFGTLQKMREMSKTGGALGQVSERELSLLTNNIAALDRNMSEAEFKKALDDIIEYATDAKTRVRGTLRQSAPPPPPIPIGTVEDGYRFKGGKPDDPTNWKPVGEP